MWARAWVSYRIIGLSAHICINKNTWTDILVFAQLTLEGKQITIMPKHSRGTERGKRDKESERCEGRATSCEAMAVVQLPGLPYHADANGKRRALLGGVGVFFYVGGARSCRVGGAEGILLHKYCLKVS